MYRILALIPARAGSKGLKHKNISKLQGIPLLGHTIKLAQKSQRKSEEWSIVVNTDSHYYAKIARFYGADVLLRKKELAMDETPLKLVIQDSVEQLDKPKNYFNVIIMLSPTTPLIKPIDVRRGIKKFKQAQGNSIASVVREKASPTWRFYIKKDRIDRNPRSHLITRRQLHEPTFLLNGAIYLASPKWLRKYGQFIQTGKTYPLIIPDDRAIDIDTYNDLKWVKFLLEKK